MKDQQPNTSNDDTKEMVDSLIDSLILGGQEYIELGQSNDEPGHDLVSELPTGQIHPSPENNRLYKPINPDSPDIRRLAESILKWGLLEPIVVTLDGWIISGHRRHAAAKLAGLATIPCREYPITRRADPDGFLVLLREHNRQRDKTLDEKLREEIVSADPEEAYESLIEHRLGRSEIDDTDTIQITGRKHRCKISPAKIPFLEAVLKVMEERRGFWPLSDRQIHYGLLNNPPLKHASKRKSRYRNDQKSYKSLIDLVTRARLDGTIPMHAIHDSTRPVSIWDAHPNPRGFVQKELNGFLKDYWRDLLQSQPNHIEIVGEKLTVESMLKPVAMKYCLPLTIGRGFCSIPPRYAMAQRYRKSGKDKLILLVVSDFDPDGEEIAHSFARSMRDDFGIHNIHPVKVALTHEQVIDRNLPPGLKAKKGSSTRSKFVEQYGESVYELEALPPEDLQNILREAIDSVIDTDAFNKEIDAEKSDAAQLQGIRVSVQSTLNDVLLNQEEGEE